MGINQNFRFLSIGLPPDIERCKQHGDFTRAIRLIDRRLSGRDGDLPEALKSCLVVERELILRIGSDYPYTRADALGIIRADIPDFDEAEFNEMMDGLRIDWIYIDGEERFFNRFYQTLIKTDAAFAARANQLRGHVDGEEDEDEGEEKALLDRTIERMKANGGVSYRLRIRASVRIKDECFKPGKVRVHLPVAAAAKQTGDIDIIALSHKPAFIAPEDAKQRTVCFEEELKENCEFFVDYAYTNTNYYVNAYDARGDAGAPVPEEYAEFLREEQPHIVFTPYIRELVRTLTDGTDDPVEKARKFYDFITLNVKYS